MIKDIIYSEDEKVVRDYNIFNGKGKYANKKGIDLIVTNKRVVVKTYKNDIFNKQLAIRETLINNLSGDIIVSLNHKISLLKVVLFIILALMFLVVAISGFGAENTGLGIVFVLLAVGFIAFIVYLFFHPQTEGRIAIYNNNALKDGIFISGGNIIKARGDVVRIIDIEKGRDFDLLQGEIGYILNELKKEGNVDELIAKLDEPKHSKPQKRKEQVSYNKPREEKPSYYDDEDDEIPLI